MKNHQTKFGRNLAFLLSVVMALSIVLVSPMETQAASKKYVKSLSVASKTSVKVGKTASVKATVKLNTKIAQKNALFKVSAKSSNTSVAAVKVGNPSGSKKAKSAVSTIKITGKSAGTATITVTTKKKNNKNKTISKKIKVTVTGSSESGSGSTGSTTGGSGSTGSTTGGSGSTGGTTGGSSSTGGTTGGNSSTGGTTGGNSSTGGTTGGSGSTGGTTGGSSSTGGTTGGSSSTGSTTGGSAGLVDNGFNWRDDVTWVDGARMITVDFTINTETTSAEELKALGYTISSDNKSASKPTICETRTYTFKKLPNTLRGLQTIPLTGEYELDQTVSGNEYAEGGIGFNTMAATVLAAATFRGYSNPSDPFGDKDPVIKELRSMFEYLNGPRSSDDIANAKWQTTISSMKSATAVNEFGNPNVYLSYLGAKSTNNYADPGAGNYKLTVYRGPYMIPAKQTSTGKRPATYMIFVGEGKSNDSEDESTWNDWGTDRYIDVWKSSDGNWYSWQNSFANVTANNFKKAEEGF